MFLLSEEVLRLLVAFGMTFLGYVGVHSILAFFHDPELTPSLFVAMAMWTYLVMWLSGTLVTLLSVVDLIRKGGFRG